MSGEAVIGVAVMGTIGVGVMVGEAAGATCALVIGGGMRGVAGLLESSFARRQQAEAARLAWTDLVVQVAVRNARIESLRAGAGERASMVDVLVPLTLAQQSADEVQSWCKQVDEQLARIDRALVEELRVAILTGVRKGLAGARVRDAGDVVPDPDPVAARRGVAAVERVLADLERVVSRLSSEALAEDRRRIAAAAARITSSSGRRDAQARLQDVRFRVEDANRRASQRREQATRAAVLMQPLRLAVEDAELRPADVAAWDHLTAALADVLAGRRGLETWMEESATRFTVEIKAAADRRYVHQRVTAGLEELGYTVDEEFETRVPVDGVLRAAHESWTAHGVRIRLDEKTSQLTAMVVRTVADDGWDVSRQDEERQAQWCDHLPELSEILRRQGIELDVVRLVPAGARVVPVVSDTPRATRTEPGSARALIRDHDDGRERPS